MSRRLTQSEIQSIQARYYYLVNYQSADVSDPIDPATYVDSNGDHLLHIAAAAGDQETVTLLLDSGVDVDLLGDMAYTALHYAHSHGHRDVATILKARGASTKLVNRFGKLPEDK